METENLTTIIFFGVIFIVNPLLIILIVSLTFDIIECLFKTLKKLFVKKQQPKKIRESMMTEEEKAQMEEWTDCSMGEVVFDSDVDKWSKSDSEFTELIKGKRKLVFMIQTEATEKGEERFGYFLSSEIVETYYRTESDDNTFIFIFKTATHIEQPTKIVSKNNKKTGYQLKKDDDRYLIDIGPFSIHKKETKKTEKCEKIRLHSLDFLSFL